MAMDHFLPFLYPTGSSPFLSFELSLCVLLCIAVFAFWLTPGGLAWALCKTRPAIPGPSGLPVLGLLFAFTNNALTHRILANLSQTFKSKTLMAFSVGSTRFVISSDPYTAKELLNSSAFADRPVKESAYELLFHRAMGFASYGEYWRNLRRISAAHLFGPKRIARFGEARAKLGQNIVKQIKSLMEIDGEVKMKKVLHFGSLNNVMMSVFGKSYDFGDRDNNNNNCNMKESDVLEKLVREGYELLGIFNWSDHFPVLRCLDLQGVRRRCRSLVAKVNVFVGMIVDEHRAKRVAKNVNNNHGDEEEDSDFVDVLLGLEKEYKLGDSDMIAVLWEMIFRGTDTIAILLEWILARMVLHPDIQAKAQSEIDAEVGSTRRPVSDSDLPNLPYLRAIVKETLRMHPPGPLLSWARLSIHDTQIGPHLVPAGTIAMVNMWAITHDQKVWPEAHSFKPERFLEGQDCDFPMMGSDLRLAPFGSGRRVCPGKNMGLATVELWLAQLLQSFKWVASDRSGVDLTETLKLSMEMKNPLVCQAIPRV